MPEEVIEGDPVIAESAKLPDNQTQEIATEPAKPSGTGNQEIEEGGTGEAATSAPKEPIPYSYEELQKVANYTELDPARLPKAVADAINATKSAQSELTKAQQRLAAQEKTAPPSQRPTDPEQAFAYDVFQAFDADNHAGVTKMVNSLTDFIESKKLDYADLVMTDPEQAAKVKASIQSNMQFKSKLDNALAMAYQDKNTNSTLYADVDAEIIKNIPNYWDVAPEIGNFAKTNLHFSEDTIKTVLNAKVLMPGIMRVYGLSQRDASQLAKKCVVELTKGMHDTYMRITGKGIKGKENRTPPKTEGGGSHAKGTDTSLDSLRKHALKTGTTEDWAKVYDKESELANLTRR